MYFGNFPDKINRKLDIIIHYLQSKNRNDGNNNTPQLKNVDFSQLQTKEEFEAFEKSIAEDAKKREQFVCIHYYIIENYIYFVCLIKFYLFRKVRLFFKFYRKLL